MTAEGPFVSTLDYFKQGCVYLNTTSSSVKKKYKNRKEAREEGVREERGREKGWKRRKEEKTEGG